MELVELDTLRDALVGLPGVSGGGSRQGRMRKSEYVDLCIM